MMVTLQARLGPAFSREVESLGLPALDAALRHRWPELREPVMLPWSDQPLLVLDGDRPWIVTAAEHDPYTRRGRTVVPHAQRREL
ncbi:MAG: hypothetical protein AB7V23_10395, partial [Candidatus Nanopelagicales bacterium]